MEATLSTLAVSTPLAVLSGGTSAGDLGVAGGLAVATILGVLGITDFLMGGDDEDEDVDDADAVFDDDGDDLDGLGGFDDDGFDGFDGDGDALGGGGGGTGTDTSELENRLDELENEVANLSSTVNTVQSENEAVSETVGDVEENVRDLLEIYEMVTRGVNPFVDETASGAMGGDFGEDFGLFGDGDDEEDGDDDVDDSIADADAEEFFEDDFDGPGGEEFADPDDAALIDDDGGIDDSGIDDSGVDDGEEFFEDDFDDFDEPGGEESAAPDDAMIPDDDGGMNDALDGGDETDGDDGTSFEELKQEYEEGDPGWDVDDPIEDETVDDLDASPEEGFEDELNDASPEEGFEDELDGASPEEGFEDELDDEEFEFIGEREDDDGIGGDGGDGRLHLQAFPGGYRADMTALEWLEYLIKVGGTGGARDALSYYVDVGWISPAVEDTLHAFLDGINVSDTDGGASEPGGLAQFDTDDHRKSLAYVARLAGDDDRAAMAQPDGSSADSIRSPETTGGAAADGGSELAPTDDPDSRGGENDGI